MWAQVCDVKFLLCEKDMSRVSWLSFVVSFRREILDLPTIARLFWKDRPETKNESKRKDKKTANESESLMK